MVDLKVLPYWARIGSAVGIIGAAYFFISAIISGIGGAGSSEVLFDLLLAGVFALLTAAIVAKAGPQRIHTDRRSGPLDY